MMRTNHILLSSFVAAALLMSVSLVSAEESAVAVPAAAHATADVTSDTTVVHSDETSVETAVDATTTEDAATDGVIEYTSADDAAGHDNHAQDESAVAPAPVK